MHNAGTIATTTCHGPDGRMCDTIYTAAHHVNAAHPMWGGIVFVAAIVAMFVIVPMIVTRGRTA